MAGWGCPPARARRGSLTLLIDSGRSMAVGFGSLARSSDHSDDAIALGPAPPPARVTACALAARPARFQIQRET